jgi:5-methylcytosine-specific restriction endonuclease McrA
MSREQIRRRRNFLFKKQGGKCYYCQQPMVPATADKYQPDNACTLEHLDDKLSPERGKHKGKERTVAACRKCNLKRGVARNKEYQKNEKGKKIPATNSAGRSEA